MSTFVTNIQRNLSILMIEHNSISHSLLRCFHHLFQTLHVQINELLLHSHLLQGTFRSMQMGLAAIGILVHAKPRFVQIAGSMGFVASVVKDTKRETMNSALLSSKLIIEHELLETRESVTKFVERGPQSLGTTSPSLRHKASATLISPHFC